MGKTNTKQVRPEDRIPVSGKLAYSIGFAGKDTFQTIVNNYLMLFLMMVAGLPGTFIGLMMLGARIWDAINDPILGSIADHTTTKYGRFRPYLFFAIPMAFVFAALFFVPGLEGNAKLVYYTIFYVLYGMAMTIIEVPYFGLAGAMSFDPTERATVTAWSRIASRIPAVGVPLLLAAIQTKIGDQQGYFVTAILIGIIAIATSFVAFFGCKEKALVNAEPSAKKHSGWKDFGDVLKGNWALLVVMLAQLFFTFNTILCDMLNTYYLTYSLGSPALIVGIGVGLVAIGAMLGQFCYPYIAQKVQSCKLIMIIGVPIYCILMFFCYVAGNVSIPIYLVVLILLNVFTGILQINVINLCFEVCDKLEYKNGVRADATVFAAVSFLMKLAAGLASTIAGIGLQWAGFEGMGPVTIEVTEQMANAVAILRFALPGVLAFLAFLAVLFYPIKKDEILEIRAELQKRHDALAENTNNLMENS